MAVPIKPVANQRSGSTPATAAQVAQAVLHAQTTRIVPRATTPGFNVQITEAQTIAATENVPNSELARTYYAHPRPPREEPPYSPPFTGGMAENRTIVGDLVLDRGDGPLDPGVTASARHLIKLERSLTIYAQNLQTVQGTLARRGGQLDFRL